MHHLAGEKGNENRKSVWRAFTLIELLIVVLIIAILAAIAIPNFLEFQTRAKIARVKSDLRTHALGLEAYCVDNDAYPLGNHIVCGLYDLTTPISYLSSLPIDPFLSANPVGMHAYGPLYFYLGGFPRGTTSDWWIYEDFRANTLGTTHDESGPVKWQMRSLGPDKIMSGSHPYDPTNGTVSPGDICLFGPGNMGLGF